MSRGPNYSALYLAQNSLHTHTLTQEHPSHLTTQTCRNATVHTLLLHENLSKLKVTACQYQSHISTDISSVSPSVLASNLFWDSRTYVCFIWLFYFRLSWGVFPDGGTGLSFIGSQPFFCWIFIPISFLMLLFFCLKSCLCVYISHFKLSEPGMSGVCNRLPQWQGSFITSTRVGKVQKSLETSDSLHVPSPSFVKGFRSNLVLEVYIQSGWMDLLTSRCKILKFATMIDLWRMGRICYIHFYKRKTTERRSCEIFPI